MKKIKIFILLSCIVLFGCAHKSQQIFIPITMQCKIENIPLKPHLPIGDLTKYSKENEIIKTYILSIHMLQKYSHDLNILLRSCQ